MTRRSTCLVNLSGAVEEADAEFQREPHTRDWRTETGDWTLLLPRPPNQAKTTPKKNNPKKNPKANNDTESLAFLGRKGRGIPALGWSNWRPWPAASSARNRGDVTLPWVSCPFQFQVATGACGACRSGLGALWGGATQALLLQWAQVGLSTRVLFGAGARAIQKLNWHCWQGPELFRIQSWINSGIIQQQTPTKHRLEKSPLHVISGLGQLQGGG